MTQVWGSCNYITIVGYVDSVFEIEGWRGGNYLCLTLSEGLSKWERKLGRGRREVCRQTVMFAKEGMVGQALSDVAMPGRRCLIFGSLDWGSKRFRGWARTIGRSLVWLDTVGDGSQLMVFSDDGPETVFNTKAALAERKTYEKRVRREKVLKDGRKKAEQVVIMKKDWEPW